VALQVLEPQAALQVSEPQAALQVSELQAALQVPGQAERAAGRADLVPILAVSEDSVEAEAVPQRALHNRRTRPIQIPATQALSTCVS